jgi:uncharacterized FlaG/YvyC family protein
MQVHLDLNANNNTLDVTSKTTQTPAPAPSPAKSQSPTANNSREDVASEISKTVPASGILQANVTFRRDSNGQIYYVVTDANSGKELREVPPAEIRKVGEGITEYLKQAEAKSSTHLEEKA